ncbi:MAG: FAD-binding oxidoreductase [Solirubrobacterales bacterium]
MLADLSRALPGLAVTAPQAHHLRDVGAEQRGIAGSASAVILPRDAEQVQEAVACCYGRDLPIVPRGGGSGLAGGAVPERGAVVLDLTGLDRFRSFEPEQLRVHVEAGVRTSEVQRRARESGLLFPPDPGAPEQSTVGGNVATNAGGPHAYRYGSTGAWVNEIEAVIANGERVVVGGPSRKWVEGLDLKSLLVGSEGALGVITAARLRLAPAPEAAFPVAAVFTSEEEGCAAVQGLVASAVACSVLDFADADAFGPLRASLGAESVPDGFLLLMEVDGSAAEASRLRKELLDFVAATATWTFAPLDLGGIRSLWGWRDDMSVRLASVYGGKVSEDIVVPVERLGEAIARVRGIGRRLGLQTACWGHAGDGNLHAALFAPDADADRLALARSGGEEVLAMSRELGAGLSGEHGIGLFKRDMMASTTSPPLTAVLSGVRVAFDPKGLFNPGKVLP